MEKPLYAVIADDLTGAGDTGVQFARAGLRTRALIGAWSVHAVQGADVVVINTESRALEPEEAYERIARTAAELRAAGAIPIYKKIDSTMRGRVGAELDALLDMFGLDMAIVSPAFPDNGRTLIGGYLLVSGQPVARTAIGRDPVAPVRESHVPTLLASQTRRSVRHIGLQVVEAGAERLCTALGAARQPGGSVVVIDAVSDGDLEVIVEAASMLENGSFVTHAGSVANGRKGGVVLVGSAGLARPLARRLRAGLRRHLGTSREARRIVLVVVGSVNPVSREQLAWLTSQQDTLVVHLDVNAALQGGDAWQQAKHSVRQVVGRAATEGRVLVLTTRGDPADVEAARRAGSAHGLGAVEVARRIAEALAEVAAGALDRLKVAGVVLTGGDTARAFLGRLGAAGIDLISEVQPGIPAGTLNSGRRPGLWVITKAGGFGSREALALAVEYLLRLP